MFWLILIGLIFLAALLVSISRRSFDGFMLMIFVLFPLIFGAVFSDEYDYKPINKKPIEVTKLEMEIASLHNSSETSGSFFLGIGSIDTEEYIFIFIGTKKEGYKRFKIPIEEVLIVETNEREPAYELSTYYYKNFFILGKKPYYEKKLYVPENTIIQKYELK